MPRFLRPHLENNTKPGERRPPGLMSTATTADLLHLPESKTNRLESVESSSVLKRSLLQFYACSVTSGKREVTTATIVGRYCVPSAPPRRAINEKKSGVSSAVTTATAARDARQASKSGMVLSGVKSNGFPAWAFAPTSFRIRRNHHNLFLHFKSRCPNLSRSQTGRRILCHLPNRSDFTFPLCPPTTILSSFHKETTTAPNRTTILRP